MQGLPAGWNADPARAALEHELIFLRTWQFVCHIADLPAPGTAARFDCAGRSAFVLQTRSGAIAAFVNACRHRGARLVDGDAHTGLAYCIDGRVRCPYHGWTYDEAGALAFIPGTQDFAGLDREAHALHALHVAQWHGLVFVAFGKPVQALDAMLAPLAAAWPDSAALRRLHEPRTLQVPADWKLTCQHLLDSAHLDVARPQLQARVFAAAQFTIAGMHALSATAPLANAGNAPWSARTYQLLLPGDAAAPRADYLYLWPNLLLCHAPDGLAVTQVLPESAGCSRLREIRYGLPDGSRTTRLLRYAYERVRRRARHDDLRVLERAQAGARSLDPAMVGPIDAREFALHWFVERYHAALAGAGSRIKLNARRHRVAKSGEPATT
ncbi:MAG TPA: aromatic ring-hydroxylating dioxygenase subunit alpha [Steroidobacteraceae bacterium]